jgi:hypothetical protein
MSTQPTASLSSCFILAVPPGSAVGEPPNLRVRPDRRDVATRRRLEHRIASEFREMPGLCLTVAQATKLFDVGPQVCVRLLDRLVVQGLLCVAKDRRYRVPDLAA